MGQPQITIQDSLTTQHIGRLWFNKNEWHRFRYFGTTTDNTPTELFIDGISGNRLKLPNDCGALFICKYVAFNTTDSKVTGGIVATTYRMITATTAEAAADVAVMAATGDATPGATIALSADDTNDAIVITVTGTAAKTIYYECIVEVVVATVPESNFGRVN